MKKMGALCLYLKGIRNGDLVLSCHLLRKTLYQPHHP